jgi:hypothetical protein
MDHPHMAESWVESYRMWGEHVGSVMDRSATAEQRVELRDLAGSADREEADRARAILLSLE